MRRTPLLRILIWFSFLGMFALVWSAAVAPVLAWRVDASTRLEAAQSKANRLLTSISSLERELSALSAETEFDDIWTAQSVSEATAQVQATLGAIARQEGVTFRSISPLPSPNMPLMSSVAFRVEAELTLDRFVALLQAFEYSNPLLMIERSNIRRLARGSTSGTQPTVFIQLDITAPVLIAEEET